jgi:hypothetical protein
MKRYAIVFGVLCSQVVLGCGSGGSDKPSGSGDAGGSGRTALAGASGAQSLAGAAGEQERVAAGGAGGGRALDGIAGGEAGSALDGIAGGEAGSALDGIASGEAGVEANGGSAGAPALAGAAGQGAASSDGSAGGPSAAGAPGGSGCQERCAQGRTCLRGACVTDCGADLAAIDEALAEDVAVIAHFCRAPAAVGTSWDPERETGTAYELTATASGKTSTLTVSSWPVDPAVPEPKPVEVFATTVADPDGVFPSSYVAVRGTPATVAVGYTNAAWGGQLLVGKADGDARTLEAPGNYSAAWAEAGALLLNGSGAGEAAEGQGLYWVSTSSEQLSGVNVATHVGTYSGSVAVAHRDGLVLAGGAGDVESLFVLPLDRLRAVALGEGEAVDARTDPDVQTLESSSTFDLLSDRSLLTRQFVPWPALDVSVVDWTISHGKVVLGAVHAVSQGDVFSAAIPAGGRILLQHAAGLLLVELQG